MDDVRHIGGVNLIQALWWNCGNSRRDAKGACQVKQNEALSTDARCEDGLARSSDEAAVMAVERRGRVALVDSGVNSFGRMSV